MQSRVCERKTACFISLQGFVGKLSLSNFFWNIFEDSYNNQFNYFYGLNFTLCVKWNSLCNISLKSISKKVKYDTKKAIIGPEVQTVNFVRKSVMLDNVHSVRYTVKWNFYKVIFVGFFHRVLQQGFLYIFS